MKERIAKKLKLDANEAVKPPVQEEEAKTEKKTTSRRQVSYFFLLFSLFTVLFSVQFQFYSYNIARLALH